MAQTSDVETRREIAKPYPNQCRCLTCESDVGVTVATPNLTGVVRPAGPKPLRRGEGPVIHIFSSLSANKKCRSEHLVRNALRFCPTMATLRVA
jgi:hypothetical protein